jgi:hypothetical protein
MRFNWPCVSNASPRGAEVTGRATLPSTYMKSSGRRILPLNVATGGFYLGEPFSHLD